MDKKISKIKIQLILLILGIIKILASFLIKTMFWAMKIVKLFFIFILKIIIIPALPFILKIKKSISQRLSTIHYEGDLLTFLTRQRLLFIFLIFIIIFIFFEGKASFQDEIIAEAMATTDKKNDYPADFKMAADEELILKPISFFDYNFVQTRIEPEKYIVQGGDTVSSIAKKFGVSVNTILWENKLSPYTVIRAGQALTVLPISGISYKIKSGDTLDKIAKNYKAKNEEISRFNNLAESGLIAGQTIIIPNGVMPAPPPQPTILARTTAPDKTWLADAGEKTRQGSGCRDFFAGQCTWYVARKYCLTFSGHAKSWLANASRAGYAIGNTPRIGAIVSTKESYYGHVAIVEEIKSNSIIISEMNHVKPWVVNKRELSINDRRINGYIYPKEIF